MFILFGCSGLYDDVRRWPVAIYTSREVAETEAQRRNALVAAEGWQDVPTYSAAEALGREFSREEQDRLRAVLNDADLSLEVTGVEYYVHVKDVPLA